MKLSKYLLILKSALALGLIILLFSGCNKWLDIEPENDLIQQEFWKTKDDLMSVVAATYDSFRTSNEKSFYMGEVRADVISAKEGDYVAIGKNNIDISNMVAKWTEYYNTINLANTVMFYIPLVKEKDKTVTDQVVNGITAEMLYLRSLSYFYLVRIWKDVPLVLNATVSDTVDIYKPKSTDIVVLSQIETDLKKAIELASDDASDKGHANKYAMQALLADVYLWGEKYNECITFCDYIINSGKFSVESKDSWFNLYFPGNSASEGIFEIQYGYAYEGQGSDFYRTWYRGYPDNPATPSGVIKNSEVKIAKIGFDVKNDIRYCGGKAPMWKYSGTDELGKVKRTGADKDANFIYYRYADVILMKAEAMAEIGNFAEANSLVAQITDQRGITYTPSNDLKLFRSALLAERGREFAGEGKRWFDLLRNAKKDEYKDKQFLIDIMLSKAQGAQEIAVMKTKVTDPLSYYLPIHKDEIQNNKNLVQNPFYDR